MKLNLKLALTANPAQRSALAKGATTPFLPTPGAFPGSACAAQRRLPFALLNSRTRKPVRIAPPVPAARPVLRASKSYLQALRAAELAVWQASAKFPTF